MTHIFQMSNLPRHQLLPMSTSPKHQLLPMSTLPEHQLELFKKMGYHIVGTHGAVKPCLWSGRSIKGKGSCYKSQFYDIQSHRCIQMTPFLGCNQSCLHCWRPVEHPVDTPADWDSPEEIVGGCIMEQRRLMSAISLAGEPTLYPFLPELVQEFHKQGLTTFVVTNGTKPDVIEIIRPSQLYMSLDAPDKETYIHSCAPDHKDQWERILESLEVLCHHPCRIAIRLTLTKGLNFKDVTGYARLIKLAEPDFVEVKAYMHLGYSRKRLERDAMPRHEEILEFTSELGRELGYHMADDVELSRVALLSKNEKVTPVTL